MNKKLERRLRWLWDNRTTPVDAEHLETFDAARYVPLAFSSAGPGWGVYDRLGERFLTDDEVIAMPVQKLRNATVLH